MIQLQINHMFKVSIYEHNMENFSYKFVLFEQHLLSLFLNFLSELTISYYQAHNLSKNLFYQLWELIYGHNSSFPMQRIIFQNLYFLKPTYKNLLSLVRTYFYISESFLFGYLISLIAYFYKDASKNRFLTSHTFLSPYYSLISYSFFV